ncbi:MAG: hypothetical protein FD130_2231 [Halothiobacillaceae bacterium]|nr:MAG: hypothetical protein FD130_2231 [Halothiobacillaceae bacterium]
MALKLALRAAKKELQQLSTDALLARREAKWMAFGSFTEKPKEKEGRSVANLFGTST